MQKKEAKTKKKGVWRDDDEEWRMANAEKGEICG